MLSPRFLTDLETRMRMVTAQEYERLTSDLWVWKVAKEMPVTGMRERLIWLLDTAGIDYVNKYGGEYNFEEMVSKTTEYEVKEASKGLEIDRTKFEDLGGGGVNEATHWSRQVGAYAKYWPQKQVASAIRNGGAAGSLAYDGVPFFSKLHPVNPFRSELGNFANDFTGAAAGVYPGALKIDESVTLDVAFQNVAKAITYISSLKMANGEDPRCIKVRGIMGPPALRTRIAQLCNAKYIAQAASGGGFGVGDVEAVVRSWGFAEPIEATELGAGYTNGSDTSWYLLTDLAETDEMGPILYLNREPFTVLYNDEMTSAQLARARKLQWLIRGRNAVQYGHPYELFRCQAT